MDRLNYEYSHEHALGAGPLPLVLIHPLGSNIRFWDRFIAEFASYPAIALDWRGCGKSPRITGEWTVDDHADDVDLLLDHLGVSDAVLVGVAVGAMIAMAHAVRHPRRTRGLVLTNPSTLVTKSRTQERIALIREKGLEGLLPGAVDGAFNELPRDEAYRDYFDIYRDNDAESFAKVMEGVSNTDLAGSIGSISCPTLVVVGEKDKLFPVPVGRKVADMIPGASFETIVQAAHFPPYQAPEAFARLVRPFVRGLA